MLIYDYYKIINDCYEILRDSSSYNQDLKIYETRKRLLRYLIMVDKRYKEEIIMDNKWINTINTYISLEQLLSDKCYIYCMYSIIRNDFNHFKYDIIIKYDITYNNELLEEINALNTIISLTTKFDLANIVDRINKLKNNVLLILLEKEKHKC